MPERDGYIPGVPCWVDASLPDPDAALDFYAGLFGWEFEDVMPPGSKGKYFIARLQARSRSRRLRRLCGTHISWSGAPTRPHPRCALPAEAS